MNERYTALIAVVLFYISTVFGVVSWNYQYAETEQSRQKADSLRQVIQSQRDSLRKLSARHERRVRWMTRALVSETNNTGEMRYLAWVIRNRVERSWRGQDTYKGVILDPYQFSAFNRGRSTRAFFMEMTSENTPFGSRWHEARRIASDVILAERDEKAFSATHFYSPVSMKTAAPKWAWTLKEIEVASVDSDRFRFFVNEQS